MIVVVFDEESKAFEASKALTKLDADADISVYSECVIKKNSDNTVSIEQSSEVFPIGTVAGTAIGALIGLLGDVPGIGAVGGSITGSALDLDRAGVNVDFLADVSTKLQPGKWATVADISEENTSPVDNTMKGFGGHVFRQTRQSIEERQYDREVNSIQSEIKELNKEEKAEVRDEKKAVLHAKAEGLRNKLHNKLEEAKMRADERKKEAHVKIKYLEKKLATTRGNAKTRIEQRVIEIRSHDVPKSAEPRAQQN